MQRKFHGEMVVFKINGPGKHRYQKEKKIKHDP